jgi:cytochrome P450
MAAGCVTPIPCSHMTALRHTCCGPVIRGRYLDGTPAWFVTRFDDVRSVLRDPRFVNNVSSVPGQETADPHEKLAESLGFPGDLTQYLMRNVLSSDPPDHTRQRRIVMRAFTGKRVAEMRPRVEKLADELLWPEWEPLPRCRLFNLHPFPLC